MSAIHDSGVPCWAAPVRGQSLTKKFPGVLALDSVDFEARAGEVTGLIGAGGAGKSTLCGVLTGGVRPDTGNLRVSGPSVLIQVHEWSR